jgi:hypothetical protein
MVLRLPAGDFLRTCFLSLLVLCVAGCVSPLFAQQVLSQFAPDTIYYNGKIVTVDKPFTKPGDVIVASGGWTARDFPEKRGPNKKDLDAAVPNNPVFLFQSGRNAHFVILDADVMTVPEDKVKDLHPLATYVGAHKVYAKAGGGF